MRQLAILTLSALAMLTLTGRLNLAMASGHGPVFGMTTPTNAKKGWSLDLGLMGRKGERNPGAMFRGMLGYGITEDLQISFSAPAVFASAPLAPSRTTGMMPASADFEGIVAWRFHRQGTDVGSRFESTAYGGIIVPGPQRPAGMAGTLNKAPGIYTAVSTGVASRSHYVWGGTSYTRFAEDEGDRRPDLLSYSLVWGYRPRPWRKEYPHWDWRFFIEMTGERASKLRRLGLEHPLTGGHQIFAGPATLGIYKNYAVEAGIEFPLYRNVRPAHEREDFRFALNFSYFF